MITLLPKLSIIVPVYNAEQYLSRCIDSILAQTFIDFELLLINDGSKDKSGDICDKYAIKDKRVKVFHKVNGGVSSARNFGLNHALGEWVCFCDSDDYVSNTYLHNLEKQIICDKQIIMTGYDIIGSEIKYKYHNICLNGNEFIKYLLDKRIIFNSQPWGKLYNLKLIKSNHIYFPENINLGEDAIFNIKYYYLCDCLTLSGDIDYHYEKSNISSLTRRINSFQSEWNTFVMWKENLIKLLTRFPIFQDPLCIAWNYGLGGQFIRCIRSIYDKRNNYKYYDQMSKLHFIPKDEYRQFCSYYKCKHVKEKINLFFLSHRLFTLLLIFNNIYKNRY